MLRNITIFVVMLDLKNTSEKFIRPVKAVDVYE